jgi:hypothetical protein
VRKEEGESYDYKVTVEGEELEKIEKRDENGQAARKKDNQFIQSPKQRYAAIPGRATLNHTRQIPVTRYTYVALDHHKICLPTKAPQRIRRILSSCELPMHHVGPQRSLPANDSLVLQR